MPPFTSLPNKSKLIIQPYEFSEKRALVETIKTK